MSRRVECEVRSFGRERGQEPASEERLPHELIRLQRSAGNQAVAALLQRKVRVPGAVIDAANYPSRQPGLEAALQDLGRAKGWKPSFVDDVRARMVEMINDAATYPGATRMFKSYKQFITTVANELLLKNAPSPRLGKQLDPLEPMEIEPGEARFDLGGQPARADPRRGVAGARGVHRGGPGGVPGRCEPP